MSTEQRAALQEHIDLWGLYYATMMAVSQHNPLWVSDHRRVVKRGDWFEVRL